MGPGVKLERWLRWFSHPFGGVVCRVHALYPAFLLPAFFAPVSSEVAVGFFHLLVSLPQVHMHTIIFSLILFHCILLLQETSVQVQALQCKSSQAQPGSILFQYDLILI